MMIKRNIKGFGSYEVLLMILVFLVLAAVIWGVALKSSYNEKYRVFRYNAKIFALNAVTAQYQKDNNSISLLELINEGYISNIKNPFIGEKYCSIHESKVNFEGSKRYTTLRCGNYLIDHQYIGDSKYIIYQVIIDWQQIKPRVSKKVIDEKLAYNYQENNHLVYEKFYDKEVFLYMFNKKNNTEYKSIDEIPHKYNIIERRFYRVKKLVEKIKA